MDCERSNITILVVDHDEMSLTFVANTLRARQYKVQTAKNAHDALVTLRNNEGLFDIIITEFHVLGMDGFDFQKHIQDQFQIPLIMMSKDNRQHLISKTLENGATHFIVKPVCAEDFRDIPKYVVEAKKHKLFIENLFVQSEEKESSEQAKTKKEDCKRKSVDESPGEEKYQLVKKSSRLVWTTELHNLFLDAIKKVGLRKAVPAKILEIMNIPNLTRDNVASHLQKYRLFLNKVVEKEMVGDVSDRALRSKFASNLPTSLISEILDMKTSIFHAPALYQTGERRNALKIYNKFSSNNNDFAYIQKGLSLQDFDQYRQLGKSKSETNVFASSGFSSYGSRQGLMDAASSSSSSFLTRKLGETSYQNGSIGNDYFNHMNHGVKNWNFEYLNKSSIFPPNVPCDARNNNPLGIKINNRSEIGGIGTMNKRGFYGFGLRYDNENSNNFGLNVGGQNTNINFESLAHENFGSVQGGFGSLSYARGGNGSEFREQLYNEENVSENREISLQKSNRNIVQYEQNYNGGTSTNVPEFNQMEFNISNFSMADDMDLLDKMNENNDTSAFLKSDLITSIQDVQPLNQIYKGGDDTSLVGNTSCVLNGSPISVNQNSMQLYKGGDVNVISSSAKINSCMLNESPISLDQNSYQLQGNEQFSNGELYDMFMGDKMSEASTSASNPKRDMDLFEAVFGTTNN